MTTLKEIKKKISADTYSIKNGVVTLRWGFFYTMGVTAQHKENAVRKAFPQAVILDRGEVWKAFRGGASIANQSHWFVKFTL